LCVTNPTMRLILNSGVIRPMEVLPRKRGLPCVEFRTSCYELAVPCLAISPRSFVAITHVYVPYVKANYATPPARLPSPSFGVLV
jgi:hypothetical protein